MCVFSSINIISLKELQIRALFMSELFRVCMVACVCVCNLQTISCFFLIGFKYGDVFLTAAVDVDLCRCF